MTMVQTSTSHANFHAACSMRAHFGYSTSSDQMATLLTAGELGGLHIIEGIYDEPIGYVAFASVSRESLRRLYDYGLPPAYPYEWNQGRFCIVLDVFFSPRWKIDALRAFRSWLSSKRVVAFLRKDRICIRVKRSRPRTFVKILAT